MGNRVIIGGQWGDEGKGKIVDALSQDVDWVLRYQGGANAGHTIKTGDREHVLHLVPSGIFSEQARCFLGNGMVIDPWSLRDEIITLEELGLKVRDRLFISSSAHVLMPFHRRLDELKEAKRKRASIGTTGRGIGPAYVDKIQRVGLRMGDLLLPRENLERKAIEKVLAANEVLSELYEADPLPASVVAEELVTLAQSLSPMIVNAYETLAGVRQGTESALLEGAQGTLLDIDHGTYPYVTSSNCSVGGALTGTGLPPRCLDEVLGVFKAYCTRVGNGPFPTELLSEEGEDLRQLGGEYGATTGRPRRCGWFDMVASQYSAGLNGMTGVYITKLDILDEIESIKVGVAYEVEGERFESFQMRSELLPRCTPVFQEFTGWQKPTTGCRRLTELPAAARFYLEYLEKSLGVLILGVSVGKGRDDMIWTPTGVTT
ncbi:MAG: adenylosuccinate synthase [bacterium]